MVFNKSGLDYTKILCVKLFDYDQTLKEMNREQCEY